MYICLLVSKPRADISRTALGLKCFHLHFPTWNCICKYIYNIYVRLFVYKTHCRLAYIKDIFLFFKLLFLLLYASPLPWLAYLQARQIKVLTTYTYTCFGTLYIGHSLFGTNFLRSCETDKRLCSGPVQRHRICG